MSDLTPPPDRQRQEATSLHPGARRRDQRSALRQWLGSHVIWLRWALAIGLLALAVRLVLNNPGPFIALKEIRAEILGLLVLLTVINQALMSWRLGLAVAQCGGGGVSRRTWFRLTSVGQFLNLFVPQLGNLYRAMVLKRDHGISYMLYASGLFAFVWLDLLMGFVLAMVVIAVLEPDFRLGSAPALPVLGAVFVVLVVVPVLMGRAAGCIRLGDGRLGQVQKRAARLLTAASDVLGSPRFLAQIFGLNVLMAAGQLSTLALAFSAVGGQIGLGRLMLLQVFVKLSNQVVITPGNLGLAEIVYGILADACERGFEHGVAVGLLIRTVSTATVISLGALLGGVSYLGRGRRTLKALFDPDPSVPGPANPDV